MKKNRDFFAPRQIAACELLHSVVLFMVGDSALQRDRVPMVALYKKIFPVILQLACLAETVAKQLFGPLVGVLRCN